jgi:hypothetical protein
MTLFDVEELTCYWIEHPPTHLLIAAYLGAKKRSRNPQVPISTERGKSEQLLTELGPAFTCGDIHAGLWPVELDFSKLRRITQNLSD